MPLGSRVCARRPHCATHSVRLDIPATRFDGLRYRPSRFLNLFCSIHCIFIRTPPRVLSAFILGQKPYFCSSTRTFSTGACFFAFGQNSIVHDIGLIHISLAAGTSPAQLCQGQVRHHSVNIFRFNILLFEVMG